MHVLLGGRGDRARAARSLDRLPGRPVHGDHGAVRLRQVDAHAPAGGPRPARHRARSSSTGRSPADPRRQAHCPALRRDKLGFVFQAFNLIPVLSAPREHHAAPDPRGDQGRRRVVRHARRRGRARRPAHPSPVRALRRPAAARGDRARPGLAARGRVRGRADRQPRLCSRRARCSGCSRRAVDDFGQTVIMVTHDAGAAATADRVVMLQDGSDRARRGPRSPRTPCWT